MSITDQQFEVIILRLEAGESIASVQADFPHLQKDMAALEDLQDFFAAQRLTHKPDPHSLKSVLRQVDLLQQRTEDDERTWGAFFRPFRRYAAVALPVLMVVGFSGYVWGPAALNLDSSTTSNKSPAIISRAPSELVMQETTTALTTKESRTVTDSMDSDSTDMDALVQSLSDEFASDMADFETTQESLEPLFTEQLFSYDNAPTL